MLEVKDLCIEFHDHTIPESVVKHFCLHMEPGDITGIVGESGSGKTMTALAIAGLLSRHDMEKKGEILFEGVDLLTCPRVWLRACQGLDISMIFQEPMTALNPLKKIGWQVEESIYLHTPLSKMERYERVLEVLKKVELKEPERLYHCYPHELSGGMRQRVMIAAALISNPKLIIADEPTTALDVTVQEQIITLLKRINKEDGTAILFISHDLSLVSRLCHQVIVMHQGNTVETGTAYEVFNNPAMDYTKQLLAAIPKFEKRKI